ncbi:hypothetical protein AA0472_2554 [Acetobacter estunensis NRIC 0472]|uniref:Uncharacterized protein n=1 Tax=Acetobacter estunensis TaxID=104097 RepID=A0A967EDX4_9PROT|nr:MULTISPECIES: hypothetical protein [Acetobacter]NHO54756.1 hypothetical protein [Acetobacter estunensis]GBQ27966.1 hypothetical protein AA0472_2554 [Acetobacter estunensis NRIC 0472]
MHTREDNTSAVSGTALAIAAQPTPAASGLGPLKYAMLGLTLLPMAFASAAHAATGSSSGMGAQIQNMAQEGLDAAGFGSSAALYGMALIFLIAGIFCFYKNSKEDTRRPGLIAGGVICFAIMGISASGPSWINKSSNTATNGNAEIGTTAKSYQFQ